MKSKKIRKPVAKKVGGPIIPKNVYARRPKHKKRSTDETY